MIQPALMKVLATAAALGLAVSVGLVPPIKAWLKTRRLARERALLANDLLNVLDASIATAWIARQRIEQSRSPAEHQHQIQRWLDIVRDQRAKLDDLQGAPLLDGSFTQEIRRMRSPLAEVERVKDAAGQEALIASLRFHHDRLSDLRRQIIRDRREGQKVSSAVRR